MHVPAGSRLAKIAQCEDCRRTICGESLLPGDRVLEKRLCGVVGGALFPLLLLWILRLEERHWRAVIPLGCVVAAAWLTKSPSAVMVNYSLALLAVVLAACRRGVYGHYDGAVVALIGVRCAFYVFAAYEEKWVNIHERYIFITLFIRWLRITDAAASAESGGKAALRAKAAGDYLERRQTGSNAS